MRYSQLIDIIAREKPKSILEIGTWNGVRAVEMCSEALKYHRDVYYEGYDLFEDATEETDKREFNVKKHSSISIAYKRLIEIQKENPQFDFHLIKGNTRNTLIINKIFEFVFIDGGHSVETIRSDYEYVKKSRVVVLDDYYTKDEKGLCPDVSQLGCNALNLKGELLPKKDPVKNGGMVQMLLVKSSV